MPNDIIPWEEAVIVSQERNIALFEEKKVMITTCTSNEQLNAMKAQVNGVLLTAQQLKLRSIMEDAIELLALIRWRFAELNPPRKTGRPHKNDTGAGIVSSSKITPNEASRNRKYARQWPNKQALEADIVAMRSGNEEAERKLVVLEKPLTKKEQNIQIIESPMGEVILYMKATSELTGAASRLNKLYEACISHFGGVNEKLLGGVTESVMDINNIHRKLENMCNRTKLKGVINE